MSDVTLGSSAIAVPVMRHSRTNATRLIVIVASFVRRPGPARASGLVPERISDAGSGCCLYAAEPLVETNAAEARLAQRHQRVLFDPAPEVLGFRVAHYLSRVTDRLQVAGNEFVERRPFRAGDLDDPVARPRERHIGNVGSSIVRRDGLEQPGRNPDLVSIRARIGDTAEEFHELGRADDGVGDAGGLDKFLLRDLGAKIAI